MEHPWFQVGVQAGVGVPWYWMGKGCDEGLWCYFPIHGLTPVTVTPWCSLPA